MFLKPHNMKRKLWEGKKSRKENCTFLANTVMHFAVSTILFSMNFFLYLSKPIKGKKRKKLFRILLGDAIVWKGKHFSSEFKRAAPFWIFFFGHSCIYPNSFIHSKMTLTPLMITLLNTVIYWLCVCFYFIFNLMTLCHDIN